MEKKEKSKFGLGILIGLLITIIIGLFVFIIYDKVLSNDNKDNGKVEQDNTEKEISCNDCITELVLSSEFAKQETTENNIILKNKIRKLKIDVDNGYSVIVDGNTIHEISPYSYDSLEGVYIIGKDIIMVVTTGSDIRSNKYYFYNSNLKEISVDMTLDEWYAKSMVEQSEENTIIIKGNKIIISASRITHNKDLVLEDGSSITLCEYNYATKKSNLIQDIYEKYKGELVTAKYEIEYLGNGQFGKAKKIEELEVVDESYCNY